MVLKATVYKNIDRIMLPVGITQVVLSCLMTQWGWTPVPSEQGPEIDFVKQVVAWGLWIGAFMSFVPGLKYILDNFLLSPNSLYRNLNLFIIGYILSFLATSFGNWTRDGAGWQLYDAGLLKMSVCYTIYLIASALWAHVIKNTVAQFFGIFHLDKQFPVALTTCILAWVSHTRSSDNFGQLSNN